MRTLFKLDRTPWGQEGCVVRGGILKNIIKYGHLSYQIEQNYKY